MSILYRPTKTAAGHVCQPPQEDFCVKPPPGPAQWPSLERIKKLVAAGCTHYEVVRDVTARPGRPWSEPCPLHVPPKATKVGVKAAEPVGTLWVCNCGTVWIVRENPPIYYGSAVKPGGPPQWRVATRRERRRRGRR